MQYNVALVYLRLFDQGLALVLTQLFVHANPDHLGAQTQKPFILCIMIEVFKNSVAVL